MSTSDISLDQLEDGEIRTFQKPSTLQETGNEENSREGYVNVMARILGLHVYLYSFIQ